MSEPSRFYVVKDPKVMPAAASRLIVAITLCLAGAAMADAAEIRRGINVGEVVLEGKVEPGDCARLNDFLYRQHPWEIYLASPGGNLAEAMEIGRLVRALKMQTIVPTAWVGDPSFRYFAKQRNLKDPKGNYMCASACFFVFVAGVDRANDRDSYHVKLDDRDRYPAILGIHRPYLSENELKALSGDQAIAAGGQIRATVQSYLKEMGVSGKYADQMFSIRKDDVRWIGTRDFEADFDGVVPELRDWLDAKCGDKRTGAEKAVWETLKHKFPSQLTAAEKIVEDTL
jgi:hypothetical protein